MNYKLGTFFQKVARFFFNRVSGVCWNCGANCGFNSTMARGYLWCNHCFDRWQFVITDHNFVFNTRHFGYLTPDDVREKMARVAKPRRQ